MPIFIQPEEGKPSTRETADKEVRLNREFMGKNNGDMNSLPSFSKFRGERVAEAYMNEAVFLDPKGKTDGVFTCNAADCVLLVAVVRNPYTCEAENIGLTHMHSGMLRRDIGNLVEFFEKLTEKAHGMVEISILSGSSEAALSVFETCKQYGEIKFMNFDFEFENRRTDAAIVDRQGNIYYSGRYFFEMNDVSGKGEFDCRVIGGGTRYLYHFGTDGKGEKIFETLPRNWLSELDAPENLKVKYIEAP